MAITNYDSKPIEKQFRKQTFMPKDNRRVQKLFTEHKYLTKTFVGI